MSICTVFPSRRGFMAMGLALSGVQLAEAAVGRDGFPSKPIRVIVGVGPGGATDTTARLLAEKMSKLLGQPVVIENKAGASGTLSVAQMARSPADGYTLAWAGNSALSLAPYLYKQLGYDIRSIIPVGQAASSGFLLVASPSLGVSNVHELISYAKANPGKLSFGSNGTNGSLHLMGELLKSEGGFDALHVPFKGGVESASAIMAGNVQFMFDGISNNASLVRAGRLRALAVTGPAREKLLPDVPTIAEQGFPNMTAEIYLGLIAAPNTPLPVIDVLSGAMKTALTDSELRVALEKSGNEPKFSTPAEFRELIDKESTRFRKLLRTKGVQPE